MAIGLVSGTPNNGMALKQRFCGAAGRNDLTFGRLRPVEKKWF